MMVACLGQNYILSQAIIMVMNSILICLGKAHHVPLQLMSVCVCVHMWALCGRIPDYLNIMPF